MSNNEPQEIKTKGKVLRCPNCGASDAEYDIDAGGLRCNHCRTVFASPKVNQFGGFEELVGEVRGSGANDLRNDDYLVTFNCPSCGALVMLDKESKDIHCHWCRHNLSAAEKVPNGEMPDLILPFSVKRHTAFQKMLEFARERKVFSIGRFHWQLKEENLQPVFLPYVLVDVRAQVKVDGLGYIVDDGKMKNVKVDCEFEMRIDDLTVEASRDKLNQNSIINTNHIINSILPFDTENAVAWDARLLKGYSCEKRDVNIEGLKTRLDYQIADIAKAQIDEVALNIKGGHLNVGEVKYIGRKWKTAFFPVWLYSCRGPGFGKRRKIHYIAVNARTGEIMGSVPVKKTLWNIVMFGPLVVSIILAGFSSRLGMTWSQAFGWILLAIIILFTTSVIANARADEYVNKNARHDYEDDTKITSLNVRDNDSYSEKSLIPKTTELLLYDESGKKLEIYPFAKMTTTDDNKTTFLDMEHIYQVMLDILVIGSSLLVLGLIFASMVGWL
ncbi:hypothetical protein J5500_00350 [Candidatus Saccharibacteria bacterium]|nr:hypothetical protein [Candidatus Saccharibacteria bacterium]